MDDQAKLRCGCIKEMMFCLFCNPNDYIKTVPVNVRLKLRNCSELGTKLLEEGVSIDKVRGIIFEQSQLSSDKKTEMLQEKRVKPAENKPFDEK